MLESITETITDRRNQASGAVMGLGEHLEELRSRLIWAIYGLVPIFIIAIIYGRSLMELMIAPAITALGEEGQARTLQQTGALESFSSFFYVSFLATVVVGGPWIVYQLWKFVAPGLYSSERRFAYVLAPLSMLLTIAGVCVMYFGMLPLTLAFLIGFGTSLERQTTPAAPLPAGIVLPGMPVLDADPIDAPVGSAWVLKESSEIRVRVGTEPDGTPDIRGMSLTRRSLIEVKLKLDQYVDLFVNLMIVFAICFQLPVVILLLGWAGLVKPAHLRKFRRHAFAGTLVLAAIVTPTSDPISLAVLQVPLYLLYELGIFLLWFLPAERVAKGFDKNADSVDNPDDASGP